jgi:hypothetical protein
LDQGAIGNCWFIAAAVGIMQDKTLFAKVVPQNQTLSGPNYAGIFHFRFWLYGGILKRLEFVLNRVLQSTVFLRMGRCCDR